MRTWKTSRLPRCHRVSLPSALRNLLGHHKYHQGRLTPANEPSTRGCLSQRNQMKGIIGLESLKVQYKGHGLTLDSSDTSLQTFCEYLLRNIAASCSPLLLSLALSHT